MNSVERSIRKRSASRFIFPGILLIFSVLVCWAFRPRFAVNDDFYMMMYISGYLSGEPELLPTVMQIPYSAILTFLYRLNDAIPWYTYLLLFVNFLALGIIAYYVSISENRLLKLLFVCFVIGYVVFSFLDLTFTTTSGLCIPTSCLPLICNKKKDIKLSEIILSALMMFMAINIRQECSIVLLIITFYAVSSNIFILSKTRIQEQKIIKKSILWVAMCVVLFGGSKIANDTYIKTNPDWKTYEQFHSNLGEWIDYEKITYGESEETFEKAGWDNSVYDLANAWCFICEPINQNSLKIINEDTRKIMKDEGLGYKYWQMRVSFNEIDSVSKTIILFWTILIILNGVLIKGSGLIKKYVVALGWYLIVVMMSVYLCYKGRIMDRVIFLVIVSTFLPGVYSLFSLYQAFEGKKKLVIDVVTVVFSLLLIAIGINRIVSRDTEDYIREQETANQIYAYANSNTNNIYVGDLSSPLVHDLNAYKTFKKELVPYNLLLWGGWLYNSPLMKRQLKKNGFYELNCREMLNNRCYFIGNKKVEKSFGKVL